MDTAILVDELNNNAIALLKALDKREFIFTIAALTKSPEGEDWRLTLGIPELRKRGSRDSLIKIDNVITEENLEISLSDIKLIDDQDGLFNLLRLQFHTGKEIERIFFNGNYLKGQRIPDSIIYRVN